MKALVPCLNCDGEGYILVEVCSHLEPLFDEKHTCCQCNGRGQVLTEVEGEEPDQTGTPVHLAKVAPYADPYNPFEEVVA